MKGIASLFGVNLNVFLEGSLAVRFWAVLVAVVAIGTAACDSTQSEIGKASSPPKRQAASPPQNVRGHYVRTSPAPADVAIEQAGNGWKIRAQIGGVARGASTAGDCTLVAEGRLVGNVLSAKVVPFDTDDYAITQEMADNIDGTLVVRFLNNSAVVEDSVSGSVCGNGAEASGVYHKRIEK